MDISILGIKMENKEQVYVCPACSFHTIGKNNMRRHLYRNRPCPNMNGIELTEEIRQHVLRNRMLISKNVNMVQDVKVNRRFKENVEQELSASKGLSILQQEHEILIEENKVMRAELAKLKSTVSKLCTAAGLDEETKYEQKANILVGNI